MNYFEYNFVFSIFSSNRYEVKKFVIEHVIRDIHTNITCIENELMFKILDTVTDEYIEDNQSYVFLLDKILNDEHRAYGDQLIDYFQE